MKKLICTLMVTGMALGVHAPAFAQSVLAAAAPVEAAAQVGTASTPSLQLPSSSGARKGLMWTGAGLFAGGMGVAIYGFLNNENGEFPEFGEANATNKALGAAGITAAFAGGALMFLGQRISRHAPNVQAGPGRFAVSKRVSW